MRLFQNLICKTESLQFGDAASSANFGSSTQTQVRGNWDDFILLIHQR